MSFFAMFMKNFTKHDNISRVFSADERVFGNLKFCLDVKTQNQTKFQISENSLSI